MSVKRTASPILALLAVLAAGCLVHGPERTLSVQTNTFGVEYTPRQVRSLLNDLGYRQVRFDPANDNAANTDRNTWARTTRKTVEMHFRYEPSPAIYLKVFIDKPSGEVIILYTMREGNSFTTVADEEFSRLIGALVEFAGPGKVREI